MSPTPKVSRTIKNIFSNWLGFFVAAVVSFFLSPFVVRHLGDTGYGIWVLTMSMTSYLGLLDLGVRSAVTRYVAKFHAEKSPQDSIRVFSSAMAIFLAGGAIAVIVAVVLSVSVVQHLHMPATYVQATRVVFLLTGVTIAISLISGVFGGVVAALQRFDLQNVLEISISSLKAVAIVTILSRGLGLISLAIVQLIFVAITCVGYGWLAFKLYPELTLDWKSCSRSSLKLIFSFSFYAFVLRISAYLIFYSDSVVIGARLPVSAVTFFAIAGNLLNYSRELLSGVSTTFSPIASVLDSSGDREELKRLLLKASKFAAMVFLPIGITFIVRGKSFIGLWMGPSYSELSGRVLSYLTVAQFFAAARQISGSMAIGVGKHKGMAIPSIAEGLLNLILSLALVRPLGIIGVALGTAIPNLLTNLVYWPLYVRSVFDVKPAAYAYAAWLRPAIASIPFLLCSFAVERWWPAHNLTLFFAQIALELPTILIGYWLFCATAEDRKNFSARFLRPLVASFLSSGD